MVITIAESQKCGCSRLPVENYIVCHALSEEDYKIKLDELLTHFQAKYYLIFDQQNMHLYLEPNFHILL